MKYLISFLLLLILSASSCKKTKNTGEQLPPETQEGKFTIGFKVDGKIYTAKGKGGLLSSDHIYYTFPPKDSLIYIGAGTTSSLKNRFNLFLTIKYRGAPGQYLMKAFPIQGSFIDENYGNMPTDYNTFKTSDTDTGTIHIKSFDGAISPHRTGNILSGTFEMDAVNGEGKVIHITEGRFDIGH